MLEGLVRDRNCAATTVVHILFVELSKSPLLLGQFWFAF